MPQSKGWEDCRRLNVSIMRCCPPFLPRPASPTRPRPLIQPLPCTTPTWAVKAAEVRAATTSVATLQRQLRGGEAVHLSAGRSRKRPVCASIAWRQKQKDWLGGMRKSVRNNVPHQPRKNLASSSQLKARLLPVAPSGRRPLTASTMPMPVTAPTCGAGGGRDRRMGLLTLPASAWKRGLAVRWRHGVSSKEGFIWQPQATIHLTGRTMQWVVDRGRP